MATVNESAGENMGIEENKQVVLDFYEAGARGDMDACFALNCFAHQVWE